MKKLLITGFEPFGGERINPSWEAVKLLPDTIGQWNLTKLEVPVVFERGGELIIKKAEEIQPDAIISVGQAGGRSGITPELVAVNLRWASIPDNDGGSPMDTPVRPEGPAAYFATIPARSMADAIKESGIPASLSYSAGAYVCNDVFYMLSNHFIGTGVKTGFIHVPYIPEQTDTAPSLPLETIAKGLETAIRIL